MNMAMVLLNWDLTGTPGRLTADRGFAALWVKMASALATALLYAWTVIAPVLFPNRDFS
jgi:serine incorporator 1/3